MTEKITINGKRVYEGKVTAIDKNSVKIILSNGNTGVLYVEDISNNYINPYFLFDLDAKLFVGIKQRCFDGTLIFTLKGIVSKDISDFSRCEEMYGILVATCDKGSIIQITTSLTAFISNVFLEKGTVVLASICKTDRVSNRILMLLDSIVYDDYSNVKLNINYGDIQVIEETELEIAAQFKEEKLNVRVYS